MSPEEIECIVRIIDLLRSRSLSARQLVKKCERDHLSGRYKGHSSTTIYKAIHYLEHYMVIQKRPSRRREGRGRPYMVYELRESALKGVQEDGKYSFGESFAYVMFQYHKNVKSALAGYRADMGLFVDNFLKSAIVSKLENLPLDTEEDVKTLKKTIHQTIDTDCEELKALAKKYVNLILERFGI